MKKDHLKYNKFQSQLDLPFLETPDKCLSEIFNVLDIRFGLRRDSNQKLVDLGSGTGQVIIFSAISYHIKSFGIEINQELIKEAKTRIKVIKKEKSTYRKYLKKIKLINFDFYQGNLYHFDFIYIYSLPTMQRYLKHIFLTAKKDAVIISYKYPLMDFEEVLDFKYKLESGEGEHKIIAFFYKKI
ncbi:MAG: class I SAM-dependent methyltransferase [Candidatus Lokiarchaeota archaeon]|nr:class I SAM-dependent methyltransferase [Candidatus Lokiarchaeota archaeon]